MSLVSTALDAERVAAAHAVQITCSRPQGPVLVTYHGSVSDVHGAAWFLGDCGCRICAAGDVWDANAILVSVMGDLLTHVGWQSFVFPGACTDCGEHEPAITDRLDAASLGPPTATGTTARATATATSALTCGRCSS